MCIYKIHKWEEEKNAPETHNWARTHATWSLEIQTVWFYCELVFQLDAVSSSILVRCCLLFDLYAFLHFVSLLLIHSMWIAAKEKKALIYVCINWNNCGTGMVSDTFESIEILYLIRFFKSKNQNRVVCDFRDRFSQI